MCSFVYVKLNGNTFVLKLKEGVEILEVPNMIKLPGMPHFLRGLLIQNKKHVPVIDLSAKLKMPKIEFSVNTCLILIKENIHGKELIAALLADAVLEVKIISDDKVQIEKGIPFNDFFLNSLVDDENNHYLIINMEDILKKEEVAEIEHSISEASI